MAFDYWFSWASQLQAGDELWYQRCEGGHVQACVVETCPGSNACWVEYYVKRPQGGRQHRRALVKLDELARIQREHGELIVDESLSEADANCAMASEDESAAPTRERTFSMVIADSSEDDMSVQLEPPRRAFSMLFAEEDPFPRTSAFSMLFGSEDELSERDEPLQSRPRAFSMIWSDELDAIPEQSEASTESEVSKQNSDESDPDLARSSDESGSDEHRHACKSGGCSQRSTASPDSESSGTYGEDDYLWPSAQWTLPELLRRSAAQRSQPNRLPPATFLLWASG
eukprot:s1941_g2.t1